MYCGSLMDSSCLHLQGGVTAVDNKFGARNVRGLVRGEEQNAIGHLMGAAFTLDAAGARNSLPLIFSKSPDHRRTDDAGMYGVHANVLRSKLSSRCLREKSNRSLRAVVSGRAAGTNQSED